MCLDKSNHEDVTRCVNYTVADLVAHCSAYTYDALVRMGGFVLPRLRQTSGFLPGNRVRDERHSLANGCRALFRNSQSKNRERSFHNGIAALYSDIRSGPTIVRLRR
jgi:hypothetical protein